MRKDKLLLFGLMILLISQIIISCGSHKTVYIKSNSRMVIDKKGSNDKEVKQIKSRYQSQWSEDKPVSITSDHMVYREQGDVTIFKGDVKVKQEGLMLKAPYLKVESESGIATAENGVSLIDKQHDAIINSNQLQYKQDLSYIVATDNVEFLSKDEEGHHLKLKSDRLEWQPKEGNGKAKGNVVVYYKSTTATAGSMTFSDKQKRIILESDPDKPDIKPVVLQSEDRITGDKITLVINKKTYIITGNAKAIIDTEKAGSKKGQVKDGN